MANQENNEKVSWQWRRLGVVCWSLLGLLIIIGILALFLFKLISVLAPFIYAAVIVYLLQPAVNFLESKRISRLNAILLTYLMLFVVFSAFVVFIIPIVIRDSKMLISDLPGYINWGKMLFSRYLTIFEGFRIPKEADTIISQALEGIKHSLLAVLVRIPKGTFILFGSFFNLILAPIIAFYLLKDLKVINRGLIRLISPPYRNDVQLVLGRVNKVLGGFVRGQLVDAIIVGILSSLGLFILNIDFALIIGMAAGIFNLIPYFGPVVGAVPALIIALVKFSVWKALAVVIMFLIVQQLDSLIIYPYVMKHQVGLHPLGVIFGLLAGGVLMGLVGMLIAVPLLAVGKAVIGYFIEKRDLRYEEQ